METGYASDIGGRAEQQDAVAVLAAPDNARHLLLVADGLGGHPDGARASEQAVAQARELWAGGAVSEQQAPDFLEALFRRTHAALRAHADAPGRTPGTTLVALYVDAQVAHWAHCGDSRLYQRENGRILRRTRDHTPVQEALEAGRIREQDMATDPRQNQLLQALGVVESPQVDHGSSPVATGTAFLLCSDGFWENVAPSEMAAVLAEPDLEQALAGQVDLAAERGGLQADNVTAAAWRRVPGDSG